MTTFKDELEKIVEDCMSQIILAFGADDKSQILTIKNKAITSIINLVDKEVPEKITDNPNDPFWQDEMSSNAKMTGYNQAIDDMRAKLKGVNNG